MADAACRIMLIHAVREAMAPVQQAFRALWPEAETHDLLDASLAPDLAAGGGAVDRAMTDRFLQLGQYAAGTRVDGRSTAAILFTCSAFGPAIEAVQAALPIPVLKPNEAAFEQALAAGRRIGIVVTFAPSLPPLTAELSAMAKARGAGVTIDGRIAAGAMERLREGRGDDHDALVAETVKTMSGLDAIVLGQFSMARAAPPARATTAIPVLTTPESAVERLKEIVR